MVAALIFLPEIFRRQKVRIDLAVGEIRRRKERLADFQQGTGANDEQVEVAVLPCGAIRLRAEDEHAFAGQGGEHTADFAMQSLCLVHQSAQGQKQFRGLVGPVFDVSAFLLFANQFEFMEMREFLQHSRCGQPAIAGEFPQMVFRRVGSEQAGEDQRPCLGIEEFCYHLVYIFGKCYL